MEAQSSERLATIREIEFQAIYSRLAAFRWNRTATAKSLDLGVRTVQRKIGLMKKVGFDIPESRTKSNELP